MSSPSQTKSLDHRLERLKTMITELREEDSLAELHNMLAEGVDPTLLLGCCMEGMHRIGVLFENGTYFIAALIMAGEIMRSATELLQPHLTPTVTGKGGGRIIIGTIQGDIHDLGKNLFSILLQCHGVEVIDLGVDIAPETFLNNARELRPDIIGISCVLTTSLENLKRAVALLSRRLPEPQPAILIGGTCLDERMARHIGAPLWAIDATSGLRICQRIMGMPDISDASIRG